jgi:hypothetical protein
VFEPMNICIQPFFGKDTQSNKDWIDFADSVTGKTVKLTGVPRIWPEHLTGGQGDSNPNHALELHPLVKLQDGDQPERDFTQFIFAPSGLPGISENTQTSIVGTTTVTARKTGDMVQIVFTTSGMIGNFASLDVVIAPSDIQQADGGHRMTGEVEFPGGDSFPVRMVSVAGTDIDQTIAKIAAGSKKTTLEVLALFSLSPNALLDAVNSGGTGKVRTPIQLILYGETDKQ